MWGLWELFLLFLQISVSLKLSENLKFALKKYLLTFTINLVMTVYDKFDKHFWYTFFKNFNG